MARIFLSLTETHIALAAAEALKAAGHSLVEAPALDPAAGPVAAAEIIREHNPDVVIMDYWPEDAAGVKLMQTVTDLADRPEFIFIEPKDGRLEREDLMLAFNEGARAFVPSDYQPEALVTYVERAVSGPGRLRPRALETHGTEAAVGQLEEALGDLRTHNRGYQKLIAHLLATPLKDQNRKTLVVSDSPYQLDMLKKILEEHNFSPLTASNPADGLEIALKDRPRIIISDLELEGKTGVEFCQDVKFVNKIIPCYFVICTANQDKISKVMVPGNGVDDCLIKPSGAGDTTEFISRIAIGLLL